MAHSTQSKYGARLATVLGLAALAIMLLAGCVMPDGSVYTLPANAPAAQTAQSEEPVARPMADDGPSPVQPFIDEGDAALEAGDFEGALEAYAQAIEADPNHPDAYYGRALSYGILDELDAALEDADQAVALAPAGPDNAFLRAEILQALGDPEGAEAEFGRLLAATDGGEALEILPRIQARIFRAQLRMARGDLSGAGEDYGQALRADPLIGELFGEYRRVAASAALLDEKVAEYDRFAADSDSPGAVAYAEGMKQLLLAQLAQNPDAFGPAVETLTAAIDADPELAAAYHGRGISRLGAAALQQLVGTVHVGPDSATYTDPETGEQVTVSREEWDENWELQEQLAQAARAEAIEDLSRAVELDAENAEFVHDLGVAHFAQQEAFAGAIYSTPDEAGREQALALFDQAVKLDPEWDQARLSRAIAGLHWGMQDGFSRQALETASVADLAYADDGSIVVLYEDTSFDRWDMESGELLESHTEPVVLDAEYSSIALSPDAAGVIVSNYVDGIHIWERTTGDEKVAFEGLESGNERASFSEDGTRVAAAGRETTSIWDTETGEMLLQSGGTVPIALSPDGAQLVTGLGRSNPDLTVLDVATGVTVTVLTGSVDNGDQWAGVAYSPDGQFVAALGGGAIHIWALEEVGEPRVLTQPNGARDMWFPNDSVYLDYSPDGSLIGATTGDGLIAVYDVATGEQLLVFGEEVQSGTSEYAPTFSPDGTQIVSAKPGGTLNVRDARTGELLATWERERTAELGALEQSTHDLLQQAFDDANVLIDREAGAGWPYFVRGFAATFLAQFEGFEQDEEAVAQVDADWEAFTRLSPDVRQDDVIGEMPGQVRFSSPVAPADPLMAGRIEDTEDGRILVHEAEGFQLQIPAQGPTGRVVDVYMPGGPALVRILDDFRDFSLIVLEGELGDSTAEEWVGEMLLEPGSVESIGSIQTDLGEAFIVSQPDYSVTAAVLPVDGRIFYLSYTPAWLGGDGNAFATGYGLKLQPADEVVTEFVEGVSLLAE